jgi:cyclophilin family peptidyl-prolyl cis-trans isomerase
MILASTLNRASRLAAVGLAAMLFAGCTSIPTLTPSPTPAPPGSPQPTAPAFSLGPTIAPDCPTAAPAQFTGKATVTFNTNFGKIVVAVDGSMGPNAAGAFVALAQCGYYNNVIFHRIVPQFVIQAGDGEFAREPNLNTSRMGQGGPTWTIPDDKVNTAYKRGSVAMANTGAANSANSQFFIVLTQDGADRLGNTSVDDRKYAYFGDVTTGMDVVDRIALVPLGGDPAAPSQPPSMPLQPIVIESVTVTTP